MWLIWKNEGWSLQSRRPSPQEGRKRNGTLRYTILPIQNAVDLHNQHQLRRLEETTEQMQVAKKLVASKEHPA